MTGITLTSTNATNSNRPKSNSSQIPQPPNLGVKYSPKGSHPPPFARGLMHFVVWGRMERIPLVGYGGIMFTSSLRLPNFDIVEVQHIFLYIFLDRAPKGGSSHMGFKTGENHLPPSIHFLIKKKGEG